MYKNIVTFFTLCEKNIKNIKKKKKCQKYLSKIFIEGSRKWFIFTIHIKKILWLFFAYVNIYFRSSSLRFTIHIIKYCDFFQLMWTFISDRVAYDAFPAILKGGVLSSCLYVASVSLRMCVAAAWYVVRSVIR